MAAIISYRSRVVEVAAPVWSHEMGSPAKPIFRQWDRNEGSTYHTYWSESGDQVPHVQSPHETEPVAEGNGGGETIKNNVIHFNNNPSDNGITAHYPMNKNTFQDNFT
ncbi:Uncharacterized protein Fot_23336 [Forsythia ovata]|uniref:Uncharacterized protein n=1 Tax=Forsythia ovata TaxID=205694 RepID=A0ABD1V253_9LAMI